TGSSRSWPAGWTAPRAPRGTAAGGPPSAVGGWAGAGALGTGWVVPGGDFDGTGRLAARTGPAGTPARPAGRPTTSRSRRPGRPAGRRPPGPARRPRAAPGRALRHPPRRDADRSAPPTAGVGTRPSGGYSRAAPRRDRGRRSVR